MATIGRAFAFYIKYWHEMEHMREQGFESLAKGLRRQEREETRKQIDAVRERAGRQAALLVEECGKVMKAHFKKLGCEVYLRTRESTAEKEWYVYYDLRGRGRRAWRTGMGASIDCLPDQETPAILLRLVAPTAAQVGELEGVLGEPVCKPGDLKRDWFAGSVFFAAVPIELAGWGSRKRLEADGDRLVEGTRKALSKRIDRKVVGTLLSL